MTGRVLRVLTTVLQLGFKTENQQTVSNIPLWSHPQRDVCFHRSLNRGWS